jgi:hypothetical protein
MWQICQKPSMGGKHPEMFGFYWVYHISPNFEKLPEGGYLGKASIISI